MKIRENIIIMKAITGSQAYNLATVNSDIDRRGIYLETPSQIFGLENPVSLHFESKDDVLYPFRHFMSLLCKGNPNVIELIHLEDRFYEYVDPDFRELIIQNRDLFTTKQVIKSYAGYVRSQLSLVAKNKRPEHSKNGYDAKAAMHVVRLLDQLYGLVKHNHLRVFMSDEERDRVLKVREGHFSNIGQFQHYVDVCLLGIDTLVKIHYLPETVDREWVNELMAWFYERKFNI